jgi:cold shock CspA family protein
MKGTEMAKLEAIVLWFDPIRGYGFLGLPDGQQIFVHHKNILGFAPGHRNLPKLGRVTFEMSEYDGRPCAANVELIEEAAQAGQKKLDGRKLPGGA